MNNTVKYAVVIGIIVIVAAGFLFLNSNQPESVVPKNYQNSVESSPLPAPIYENEVEAKPVDASDGVIGVYRDLPDKAEPGSEITVFLDVVLTENGYYILDETVPEGWTIVGSSKGSFEQKGHLKIVELNGNSEKIEYKILAPAETGEYVFDGMFVIGNSEQKTIIGDNTIVVE